MFKAANWDKDVPESKFTFTNVNQRKKVNANRRAKKNVNSQLSQRPASVAATTTSTVNNEAGKYVRITSANRVINQIDGNTLKPKQKYKIKHDNNQMDGKREKSPPRKKHRSNSSSNNNNNMVTQSTVANGKTTTQTNGHRKIKELQNITKSAKGNSNSQSNELNGKIKNKTGVTNEHPQKKQNHKLQHQQSKPSTASNLQSEPKTFREQLVDNLKGSRFRYLNEQLYSTTSSNASDIFRDDPEAFDAYHIGYRQQVEQWPMNPLDRIIKAIRKMPKNYTVADFGCGDGRLAKSIYQKTYSLDLVAANDSIIACDMARTPLADDSVNVAIFCLSLMGTNLKDFFLEANRVLKIGGLLKIAEVESRFSNIQQFLTNVQLCGFEMMNKDLSNNLFYFINLKKNRMIPKSENGRLPDFNLKPCLYKKR